MAVAKEQIRQIISENNSNSVADIYTLLKERKFQGYLAGADIGSHKNSANIFVTGETMEKMGIFSCKELIW